MKVIHQKMKNRKRIIKLLKTEIELQAVVPTKSIKQANEYGLKEVTIKQASEFGFEKHFDKGRIDKGRIDINFGFGKITLKKKDLQKALNKKSR